MLIVANYTVGFLGLRWSAPLARFYRPPTLLGARTTRKSNELELKYTAVPIRMLAIWALVNTCIPCVLWRAHGAYARMRRARARRAAVGSV